MMEKYPKEIKLENFFYGKIFFTKRKMNFINLIY